MSETSKCNRCGAPLPSDSPEGLCPRCLIALNLATQTEIPGETGQFKPPPAPPLPVADVAKLFPQLEILECLGRGGMGAVYKARQPRLDRVVALKILSPEKQGNQKFAERFEREARALAKLHHPNIVAVYDFGEVQGNFYLLMEFVDGLTLRQLLHTRKLSPEEALAIVPKICEALQYAHEQGIVHRDIKPENILMDKDGRIKIADFGIAKILGDGGRSSLTEEQAIGTPHYMSPEQIEKPQTVDHRADIYSLGVVFYEMLTGELPLGKFQPPSKKVHVDVRLDEIVLRTLEKEPERRYQHASEVKTEVETVAATSVSRSDQSQPKSVAMDRKPRFSRVTVIVGTLMLIIGVIAFALVHHHLAASNGVTLSESDFFQKFESGLVEHATMTINDSHETTINGKFLETDKNGKTREIAFVVPNIELTPTLEDKLVHSDKIDINIPNPLISDIGWNLLFFVPFAILLGIIILVIRLAFKSERRPVSPSAKPDHFWRKFAIVVIALISIPFVLALIGIFAAIAIPAFVHGRTEALKSRQQKTASQFYIGQTWFPESDSIEITSMEGTEDQVTVKGHYDLVSHDTASLAFYITSTNSTGFPEGTNQSITISKGSGDFELTHPHMVVGLPHVSMYGTNRHSFAAIYFGNKEEAAEESNARWITNSASASAETWSPSLATGEKPDFQKILQEADGLMNQSRYEESLQRRIWYYNHALETTDSWQHAERTSSSFIGWAQLGRRYPKAKQALLEIRDHDTQKISNGEGYFDLFQELSSINNQLQDDAATCGLFKSIAKSDPQFAGQAFIIAESILVRSGEYKTCRKFIGDPQASFQSICEPFQSQMQREAETAEMYRQRGWTNGPAFAATTKFNAMMKQNADDRFVGQVRQLIEILVGTGSKPDAESIQTQALAVLDDPRLQSAVTDAEMKVSEHNNNTSTTTSSPSLNATWVNGATVLAVESHGANNGVARWSPDGTPLPPMLQSALSNYAFPEENGWSPDYVFTILLRNPPDSSLWKYWDGGCGTGSFNPVRDPFIKFSNIGTNNNLGSVVVRWATTFNTDRESTSIIFGLPSRPPKNLLSWDGPAFQPHAQPDWPKSEQPLLLTVEAYKPFDPSVTNSPYLSAISMTDSPKYFDSEWHFYLTALDRDGREHLSTYSLFDGNRKTELWMFDVAPTNITSVKLQGYLNNEYAWSEFNNIRLKPNVGNDDQSAGPQTLADQRPVVVETFPISGARDVAPGETEIRVRFSKDMADGSWNWSGAWDNSTPDFIGQPHYDVDSRTCIVKAKLEPGHTYAFWLNSEKFQNFRDADGHPAVPYMLIFQTKQN